MSAQAEGLPLDKTYNHSIDLARIIGALAIVWFHVKLPGGWAAYAALQVFVILLTYFSARRPLAKSAQRLLLPWLIWSAIFAVMKTAQALIDGTPLATEFSFWMCLTGTALHLWFLPFSFFMLAAYAWLGRHIWWVLIPLVPLSIIAPMSAPLPIPLAQWAHVLPAAALGFWMMEREEPVLPLALTAIAASALWMAGVLTSPPQLAIGAMICLIAVLLPIPKFDAIAWAASLSLGIYLIHPFAVALILHFAAITEPWSLFAVTLVASIAGVMILKRVLPGAV